MDLLELVVKPLTRMIRSSLKMMLVVVPAIFLMEAFDMITFTSVAASNATDAINEGSKSENCTREATPCKKGLLIPMWLPQGNLSNGDKAARAIVYMSAMVYMFLGVSIVADRFMASIEVITSKEKEVVIKRPDGLTTVVNVRIWNETVSNLTLMALGSSAPEIMLSVIEICGNKFQAGDLGPSTIVGSAAFNLFVIIAICVYVIPCDENRRIKHLRVFFITATWSVFAYLWLYFILSVTSEGVVEIWEAVLTFLFFPGTVGTAYIADRKILVYKFLSKKYTTRGHKDVVIQSEGLHETEMAEGKTNQLTEEIIIRGAGGQDPTVVEFEQHRQDFISILRELRKKHPNIDMKTLEEMAEYEAVNRGPKSRAFYRIQATRKLTGGGKVIKKAKIESRSSLAEQKLDEVDDDNPVTQVFFDPGHYTVMENVGTFSVTVTREGGDITKTCYVDYTTEDGTANAGSDYIRAQGTLVFQPHERHKQFEITILDDDVFEEDEHFYVQLSNVRLGTSSGHYESGEDKAQLVTPFMATVMILDDDHPGIFHFEDAEQTVTENIGELMVRVCRASGARGTVRVPYHAVDGTAKMGKDYELTGNDILFENDQTEAFIKILIVDDEEYEKTENFSLILEEPQLLKKGSGKGEDVDSGAVVNSEDDKMAEMGKPRLGEIVKSVVRIKESQEFKSTVDKLLKKANVSLVVGTSSWREQFVEAITVSAEDEKIESPDDGESSSSGSDSGSDSSESLTPKAQREAEKLKQAPSKSDDEGEDEDGEEAEEKLPSCMDYVMHFLTLFWKILFAFVPPTDYGGGWWCFTVSITLIGFLTAIIGDLASSFGCTVGLKDAVTAISFVALGTSVPDTFASKVAAVGDRYADSSIGNVTGSNAVNVFLGIGIAWTIAAVYHRVNGNDFEVPPGTLALSVTVFCVMAALTIMILLARRHPAVGGELGGPMKYKLPTAIILVCFWIIYVLISSFTSYCYIPGF